MGVRELHETLPPAARRRPSLRRVAALTCKGEGPARVGPVEGVRRATGELFAYFETIVEARRSEPRDDLVSALLAAEEESDRLSREELLSTMLLILVAGNETTRNLIGNGMLALFRHPRSIEAPARGPEGDAGTGDTRAMTPKGVRRQTGV